MKDMGTKNKGPLKHQRVVPLAPGLTRPIGVLREGAALTIGQGRPSVDPVKLRVSGKGR